MSATIDLLPGGTWSAEAAAGDALNRVDPQAAFMAIWIDPESGAIHYSKANTKLSDLALMALFLQTLTSKGFP